MCLFSVYPCFDGCASPCITVSVSKKARTFSVSVSPRLDVGSFLVPSPSDVQCMFSGSMKFRCSVNSSEYVHFEIEQASSAYLFQNRGGWGAVARARCLHEQVAYSG